jgi:hypothetical protein
MNKDITHPYRLSRIAWDLWCIGSIVGICW